MKFVKCPSYHRNVRYGSLPDDVARNSSTYGRLVLAWLVILKIIAVRGICAGRRTVCAPFKNDMKKYLSCST